MTNLKQLIQECINEVSLEEGNLNSFLGGSLAGFITAWAVKNKPKTASKADIDKVANKAMNFQNSVSELKSALEPFAGVTTDEKMDDFLVKLNQASFNHIKPVKRNKNIK